MPQGLKPAPIIVGQIGTAEAVPFQNFDQTELLRTQKSIAQGLRPVPILFRVLGTAEAVPFQNFDQAEQEPSATNPGENHDRFFGEAHRMGMASEIVATDPMGGSHVQIFLRLEGLAAAVVSALFYARTGASWWLFAALWLLPDLSMLGYLGGPKLGARIYNAIHSYVTPGTLVAMSILLKSPALLPYAFVWINHIGVDRLMGYGLKYPQGFGFTHLGRLGKRGAETIPAS